MDRIWRGWFLFFSLSGLNVLAESLLDPGYDVVLLVHSKMFRVQSSWS